MSERIARNLRRSGLFRNLKWRLLKRNWNFRNDADGNLFVESDLRHGINLKAVVRFWEILEKSFNDPSFKNYYNCLLLCKLKSQGRAYRREASNKL